jgi:predicted transcriptional regulator YheO
MSKLFHPHPPLSAFVPVADAIALVFRPHAEVVLHDLSADAIVHIANPFSGRRAGESSMTEAAGIAPGGPAVIGPYAKRNFDGRPLKSITAVLPDGEGRPIGLLCINVDVSVFEAVAAAARGFLDFGAARSVALLDADWREEANAIVGDYLHQRGKRLSALSVAEREDLVRSLDARGFFEMRNATPHMARILGVSRATLYSTLKAVRMPPAADGERTSR